MGRRLVPLVLSVCLAASCSGGTDGAAPSLPSDRPPSPAGTASPATRSDPAPSPTPAAPVVDASDATLRKVSADDGDARRLVDGDCQTSFRLDGYDDTACNRVPMAGGDVYWVVNVRRTNEGTEYVVHVRRHLVPADTWELVLAAHRASGWSLVEGVDRDLTGSGARDLVLGYRSEGAANALAYDIVSWLPGRERPHVRAHRGELPHGSVRTRDDGIDEWSGDTTDGAKPCCPRRYRLTRIRFLDGAFRIVEERLVSPANVPQSEL